MKKTLVSQLGRSLFKSPLAPALPLLAAVSFSGLQSPVFAQGSLTPSAAPAPTMKTLAQIEPRTPISSLPFTISSSGSYYLTTNLTVATDVVGITIAANNVTLDLNGFALRGIGGYNNGIYIQGWTNITVRNGAISGWSSGEGLDAQYDTRGLVIEHILASGNNTGLYINSTGFVVRDCTCQGNSADGIYASGYNNGPGGTISGCTLVANAISGVECYYGTVKDCQFSYNTSAGIYTQSSQISGCRMDYCGTNNGYGINSAYCDIRNCVIQNSGGYGIYEYYGSRISDCSVTSCGSVGIYVVANSQINDCRVSYSGTIGINAGASSIVHNCQVDGSGTYGVEAYSSTVSGCSIVNCSLSGIYVNAPGCLITGNHVRNNNQNNNASYNAGIYVDDADNRIEDNHVVDNGIAGIVVNNSYYTGNVVVKNYVQGNGSSNYVGSASNDFGPIGSAATVTSPWANISH